MLSLPKYFALATIISQSVKKVISKGQFANLIWVTLLPGKPILLCFALLIPPLLHFPESCSRLTQSASLTLHIETKIDMEVQDGDCLDDDESQYSFLFFRLCMLFKQKHRYDIRFQRKWKKDRLLVAWRRTLALISNGPYHYRRHQPVHWVNDGQREFGGEWENRQRAPLRRQYTMSLYLWHFTGKSNGVASCGNRGVRHKRQCFRFPKQPFGIWDKSALLGSWFDLGSAHDADFGMNGLQSYVLTPNDNFVVQQHINPDGSKYAEMVLQKSLDRETQPQLSLKLIAADGGNPLRSGTVHIIVQILDANDNAPVFIQSLYKAFVIEFFKGHIYCNCQCKWHR